MSVLGGCGAEQGELDPVGVESGAAPELTTGKQTLEWTVYPTAVNDGWVIDDAENASEPTYTLGKIYWFASGDSHYDAFMTFDFTALPSTARLILADLTICVDERIGDPFRNLGPLHVQRVESYLFIDRSLHTRIALASQSFLAQMPVSGTGGCHTSDVSNLVRNAVDYHDKAYLRLAFEHKAAGGTREFIRVASSRNSVPSRRPTLKVIYSY